MSGASRPGGWPASVEERLDRLESLDAIRQLASRYGELIDARDLDALVDLFIPDVKVSRTESGHAALRKMLDHICRQFTTSIHMVGNHTIEFVDRDHARGTVYSRVEHEYGPQWVVMAIQYWDRYERRYGRWRFTGRKVHHWYAVDMLERPTGPDKTRWTVTGAHTLPDVYATWGRYWQTT